MVLSFQIFFISLAAGVCFLAGSVSRLLSYAIKTMLDSLITILRWLLILAVFAGCAMVAYDIFDKLLLEGYFSPEDQIRALIALAVLFMIFICRLWELLLGLLRLVLSPVFSIFALLFERISGFFMKKYAAFMEAVWKSLGRY